MGLVVFSFIILLFAQIALAIRTFYHRRALPKKFKYILSDLPDPATTIEKYIRIYRKINIKVNARIIEPAYAQQDFILVRRDLMYEPDLYTNFYVLTQLELTKKMYRLLRNMFSIQNVLFFGGLAIFIIGLFAHNELALILTSIGLITHVIAMVIAIIAYQLYAIALEETTYVARDLLNLDDLEFARANRLANEFGFRVFEYPLDIPIKLVSFFV